MRGLQFGSQSLILRFVEGNVRVLQLGLFRPGQLACDQVIDVRQTELLVQRDEVGLHFARAHQVNAGEQDAIDVEQRLHSAWTLLVEQLPLGLREAEVVMRVMPGYHPRSSRREEALTSLRVQSMSLVTSAATRSRSRATDLLQLRVLRRGVDNERRDKL